jgi:hypothetical protein
MTPKMKRRDFITLPQRGASLKPVNDATDRWCISVRLLAWIVSRVDVIDCPRPNTMDLKDCLFFGPGEMIHLGLHNRDAAGWYRLGFAGIKLVPHTDVKSAGDHSYMLNRWVCECAGIL